MVLATDSAVLRWWWFMFGKFLIINEILGKLCIKVSCLLSSHEFMVWFEYFTWWSTVPMSKNPLLFPPNRSHHCFFSLSLTRGLFASGEVIANYFDVLFFFGLLFSVITIEAIRNDCNHLRKCLFLRQFLIFLIRLFGFWLKIKNVSLKAQRFFFNFKRVIQKFDYRMKLDGNKELLFFY